MRWMGWRVVAVLGALLASAAPAAADVSVLKDLNLGAPSGSPFNFVAAKGKLFFSASDGTHGTELWTSDGTAAGTTMVADIAPDAPSSSPQEIVDVNGTLFFAARDDTAGGRELYKSDGTASGTMLVKDIAPGMGNDSSPQNLIAMNGALYFSADDGTNGRELWRSDGTDAGTTMLKNIRAAGASSNPNDFAVFNGKLYFQANDATNGTEPWVSDGTPGGTVMLKNINPAGNSGASNFTVAGGVLYFRANDGVNGVELWTTDGTPGGTVMLRDINPAGSSGPDIFFVLKDLLLFVADDGVHGFSLWRSNGTTAGTTLVKDIQTIPGTPFVQHGPAMIGDKVIFEAADDTHGNEPWVTDGTTAGTMLLADINPGSATSVFSQTIASLGSRAFFAATDADHGNELWTTDGTPAGTMLVGDLAPGTDSVLPQQVTAAAGRVFFDCMAPVVGQELCAATFPPSVTSAATASGRIGAPFSYVVTVDGVDPKTLTVSGLPLGLELAGDEIAGTPTEVGEFPVMLAIDTPGGSTTATVTLTIDPMPNTGPSLTTLDSDGDGFPDEIETAAGSSPMSSTSTPVGTAPAGPALPLPGTKLRASLDFAHAGRDSLSFRCSLPIPAGFDASAPLVVDVGGVVRSLRIARRRLKPRTGTVAAQITKLAMTVKRGALVPLLADEGLTSADLKSVGRTVPVAVLRDGALLSASQPVTYTAKAGKVGRAR